MTPSDLALTAPDAGRMPAPVGALVTVVAGLVVWLVVLLAAPDLALLGAVVVPGAFAAVHDLRARRIPDRSVVVVAAVAMIAIVSAAVRSGGGAVVDALLASLVCAFVVGVIHLGVHLAVPTALGFGDVKLATALALALGPAGSSFASWVLLALLFTSIAAGIAIVSAAVMRRPDVPSAPALVIAVGATLIAAHHLAGVVPT